MSGMKPVVVVPQGWGRPWHRVFTMQVTAEPPTFPGGPDGECFIPLTVDGKPTISRVGLRRWLKHGVLQRPS